MADYWVLVDWDVQNSFWQTGYVVDSSTVTFLGTPLTNLAVIFPSPSPVIKASGGVNAGYPYYTWWEHILPYSFYSDSYTSYVLQEYSTTIVDYYQVGDRPDPAVLEGPLLSLNEPSSYDRDAFTIQWTDWAWVRINGVVSSGLFTGNADSVNFNAPTSDQAASITANPASIYDAYGGNDNVHLPNADVIPGTSVAWDAMRTFYAGPGDDVIYSDVHDDTVNLGTGNDIFYGSPGKDHVLGGDGVDRFDYTAVDLHSSTAGNVETLDGGSQPSGGPGYLPAQPDVLMLPGKLGDYIVTTSGLDTRLEYNGPNGPPIKFETTGVELVTFADNTLNTVTPPNGNVFDELAHLSSDVYSPSVSQFAAARANWQPLSALELGLVPKGQTDDGLHYTLVEGHYSATWNVAGIPGLPGFADAEVAVGLVNGVRTLSLTFRGTDAVSTDWLYDFVSFPAYYAKFAPLVQAVDKYVAANGIQQVLVDGHSLGASMVQLFMDSHPDANGVSYGALAIALPGVFKDLINPDDSRQLDLLHTKDIVSNLPLLTQNGTKVWIDSSASYLHTTFEHGDASYIGDYEELLSFAKDSTSPFASSALAKALKAGATSLSSYYTALDDHARADGVFTIALNSTGTLIQTHLDDDYALGSLSNDEFDWNLSYTPAQLWHPLAAPYTIFDGAGGNANQLNLPGLPLQWSAAKAGNGQYYVLHQLGISVGELWNIQKLVFLGGLLSKPLTGAALTEQSLGASADTSTFVPVVWLDGRAATVEAPTADATTYNVVGTSDYVQLGNQDITVIGSDHGDIIMLGTGNQQVTGGSGNDIINGNVAGSGAVFNLGGGAGDDLIIGAAGNDVLNGGDGSDILQGGAGNDMFTGGAGGDTLTGGEGSNVFIDTAANLNGDTITDLSTSDRIVISDASLSDFTASLTGNVLTYTGGSLLLSNNPIGRIIANAAPGGGVQLTMQPSTPDNDFNGDGRSDLLWRNDNGALTDWLGGADGAFAPNGATLLTVVDTSWQIAGTGDFNGDGRVDVLWHRSDGALTDWLGTANGGLSPNGANLLTVVDPQWQIAGTGDFNGDGIDDVLWHRSDGALTDWLGTTNGGLDPNGANLLTVVDPQWQIAGTGDFNGDGITDVLWHRSDGALTDWLGTANGGLDPNGANLLTVVDPQWQIAGVGDFSGDGKDDVIWHRSDGATTDWLGTANGGLAPNGSNFLTVVNSLWSIAAIGDYNGDHRDDILWRNSDGRITDWLGNTAGSFTDNAANALNPVDTHWHVQPHEGLF